METHQDEPIKWIAEGGADFNYNLANKTAPSNSVYVSLHHNSIITRSSVHEQS